MNSDNTKIYDVSIDNFEKLRASEIKSGESLFISSPNEILGLEAYSQLLPPVMKFGKLFRLRKNKIDFPKNGILLRQKSNVALLPLVHTSSEVAETVKLFFGENMYKQMIFNYIFPRKMGYKNPFIPGSKKIIKTNKPDDFIQIKNKYLPGLTQLPSYMIKNLKNTVFDLTDILNETLPNLKMCSRPAVMRTSETIILQNILRLVFSDSNEETPLFSTYMSSLPPIADNFKNIIIPFKITSKDKRIPNIWINPEFKLTSNILKRDPEISSHLGILKFVIGLLDDSPFENSSISRLLKDYIKRMDHVTFIFYNETHAFYVDYKEFIEKGMRFDSTFRFIKSSLKILIGLNNSEISDNEVDELVIQMINSSDGDSEEVSNNINSTISNNAEFNKQMIQDINKPVIEAEKTVASKSDISSFNSKLKASDKQLLDYIKNNNPKNNKSTLELLTEAKLRLDKQIELGFKTENELSKQKQTNIVVSSDEKKEINNLSKLHEFINKVQNFTDEDNPDDDWDFDDDNNEDENENETEEPDETASDNEPSEDDIEEEDDFEEDESSDDEDFMDEHDKKNQSNATTAIINSVRETLEGKTSAKQQAYYNSIKDKYKSIKFSENETLEDVLNRANTVSIDNHDEKLDLADSSFNTSILTDFTKSYVKKTLAQDIVANIKAFSDENKSNQMAIVKFEKEDISDQFNKLERYRFELKDKFGKSHNITFKLPKIDDDGFMYIGGNTKMLKKQWILKPVTKTSPDEVYVLSNYNKVRIFRSGQKINKLSIALSKFISQISKEASNYIKDIEIYRGNNSKINLEYDTSIEYDELACMYDKIIINPKSTKEIVYYFNQKEIHDVITNNHIKFNFDSTEIPVGIRADNSVITLDKVKLDSSVSKLIFEDIKSTDNPNLISLIDKTINSVKGNVKKIFSKIEIQSKEIPLIIFLSGTFGFQKVLEAGNIKTLFIPKGTKHSELSEEDKAFIDPNNSNYLQFADGSLYYGMFPLDHAMLLNGLCMLPLSTMDFKDLDNLNTYIEFTYNKFETRNLIKGWIAFRDLFLDPKTLEIIKELHLPTDLCELLIYANSLLQDNQFTPSGEVSSWRIRDYEVLPDLLYNSISENYRIYMQKGKSREGFSIPEEDIINKLNKSFILVNYDTTSPGSELREKSGVTFKGPNGINMDRAFTLDKRGQTISNIGTEAISGPDNGNIGINRQLTVNPRIVNTYGFVQSTTVKETKNLSASSLYAFEECIPYGVYNDPKRIGFLSSQTKHLVAGAAFDVPMVGTGMERTVPYKVSSTFGYKAKQNGKIIKVDEENKYVLIKYNDGTTDRVDFGNRNIKNSDFFLANNIEVDVKEGQSVKEGQIITHNKDYFKKSMGRLIYTQGALARVAIHEGEVTEEDSSAISWRLAKKVATTIIKRKQIVLNPTANIISSVKIGDHVTYGDPLLIYEDAKDADSDMALLDQLGDVDDDVLDTIARHSSGANYTGKIHDIKMYWTIDPDLMGESAKKFVKQYIAKINKEIKEEEALTNTPSKRRMEVRVSKPLNSMKNRLNGVLVNPKTGSIVIEYYIEHVEDRHPGDKIALMPALKTVINKTMEKDECAYRINSKSKFNTIDFIQSTIGVLNRMVCSTFLNGYLSKILFERGKEIAEEYFKNKE